MVARHSWPLRSRSEAESRTSRDSLEDKLRLVASMKLQELKPILRMTIPSSNMYLYASHISSTA